MDESENDENFRAVIKAHTEAYLEFHVALIKILNNQKDILTNIESFKSLSDDEFRNLSKEYHALEKIFTNFQTLQITRDQGLEGATEDFKATITNFNEDLVRLGNEITELKSLQLDIKNFWNKITAIVGGVVGFLTIMQLITGKGLIDYFNK